MVYWQHTICAVPTCSAQENVSFGGMTSVHAPAAPPGDATGAAAAAAAAGDAGGAHLPHVIMQ